MKKEVYFDNKKIVEISHKILPMGYGNRKKNSKIYIFEDGSYIKSQDTCGQKFKYICSECGKEVMYNTDEMEELPIFEPRDIYSDENELSNVTEYMDMQVSEQTFGKPLCRNCLKKYLENNKI